MMHAAFFDMDGTVVCTRFCVDGKNQIGFDPENWKQYCTAHPRDAYKDCVPVDVTIQYAKKLRKLGWYTYILTVPLSEGEKTAKLEWLKKYDPNNAIFNDIYFSETAGDKIRIISEFAERYDMVLSDCLLVEDTFNTLILAIKAGIQALHVTNLVTGCEDVLDHNNDITYREWYNLNQNFILSRLVSITLEDPNCGGYCLFNDMVLNHEYALRLFGDLKLKCFNGGRSKDDHEILSIWLQLV